MHENMNYEDINYCGWGIWYLLRGEVFFEGFYADEALAQEEAIRRNRQEGIDRRHLIKVDAVSGSNWSVLDVKVFSHQLARLRGKRWARSRAYSCALKCYGDALKAKGGLLGI